MIVENRCSRNRWMKKAMNSKTRVINKARSGPWTSTLTDQNWGLHTATRAKKW